ncbi:MAG TPA: C25 family cysteine peptidase [Candidatus Krumholzibacteria bacterium]|nr:C25 family cysteine peptidase [Candidatus Krumholzibacteria bacterium]HPD73199.1 C25 family cysteine peptidase [Candidatus Krumholzibacteria bacterium]HRY40161.1 C25 family cysteine peptidase [Candidatus Krumholzibacteria bacterium]
MRTCYPTRIAGARLLGALALAVALAPMSAFAAWIDLGGGDPLAVELLANDDGRIVYSVTVGGFEATPVLIGGETYYEITVPGIARLLEAGYPALPSVRTALCIPDDRAMSVTVLSADDVDLPDMPVAPSKGNLSRAIDPASVPYVFAPFYQSDRTWPDTVVMGEDPHIVRDLRGMVVAANVFQYLPADQILRVHRRLVIEVADSGGSGANVLVRTSPFTTVDRQFARLYESHFLNGLPSRYVPVEEDGGLLIVAYDAFAASMQPLVEWKLQKGLDTRLVTLSETGSTFSQIKSYIGNALASWAPAYVLLVGDLAQIPIGADSDPEYSTLLGSDSYPDLFVGRFSAENASQVATQVLRTITYERDHAADLTWPQYGTGIASNQGPGDDNEYDNQHMDVIRQKLLAYGYLGVDQIYDPSGTAAMVTAALNAGRGIVNYTGHGSQTAWSSTGFSNTHVAALTNQNKLPFILSVACNNGTFSGTCFAEAWLRAANGGVPTGAIATYMSYISQSWDPPMCGQDAAIDLLVGDEMRTIGGLWFNGSCQMMDEYGTAGVNEFLNWTIFGDPSLAVRTKAAATMTVAHSGVLLIGMNEYSVDTGTPGALCALYGDGVLYGTALADAGGHATIVIAEPPADPMALTLTVTAYNKVTVQAPVEVLPPEGPFLVFDGLAVWDPAGDGDNLADAGETFDLVVTLENVGVDPAENLTAQIASIDRYIEIVTADATYADIPAGASASCDTPFTITVLGAAPDGYLAQLSLLVTGSNGSWNLPFTLPVQAPVLAAGNGLVDDDSGGDGSGTADAGEVFQLQIALHNSGGSDATAVSGILSCADPNVIVHGSGGSCSLVAAGHNGWIGTFDVEVLAACPEPSMLTFALAVATVSGYQADLEFNLPVGGWFDDVEVDRGWLVGIAGDTATSGQWVRADPVGTTYNSAVVQTEDDHTPAPGTICFVTGNAGAGEAAGAADVDGGTTTLLSPVFDLSNALGATVSYWRWYTNNLGNNPGEDWWDVAVTNDGATWVVLEHTQASAATWQQFTFMLDAYIELTDQVQLRFVASDANLGSLVEAAVDDFLLDAYYGVSTAVGDEPDLPGVLTLERCFPNPFNPQTRITFTVPRASEVDLAVYDVSGRRVTTLVTGMVDTGRHEVVWQGVDERGGVVPSGVYFSRLSANGELLTSKMLLLK